MSTVPLLRQLQHYQTGVRDLYLQARADYRRQYHPDLSPIGWHLGHCLHTESYWVREMWLKEPPCDKTPGQLYNPVLSRKPERGGALPEHDELCEWAQQIQAETIGLLEKYRNHHDPLELMRDDFLLHFLIQHYAQHYETMQMVRAQANLHAGTTIEIKTPLPSAALDRTAATLPGGNYTVGANGQHRPYDNEYPGHQTEIDEIAIGVRPVSNAEYLCFMDEDGYDHQDYWSEAGWQWLQQHRQAAPEFWHRNDAGHWYGIDHRGAFELAATAAVHGISHYEAEAFAHWARARLPHEHEWEAAAIAGLLTGDGSVWEWCHNAFYPYPGFTAYPYAGYSLPYYDGGHYTLKGGSVLTRPPIRRPSFRNFYQAGTRFLYAGLRLVFE